MASSSPPVTSSSVNDETDFHIGALGGGIDTSRSKLARDRLQAKITRIMDMISAEQTAKEGLVYTMLWPSLTKD